MPKRKKKFHDVVTVTEKGACHAVRNVQTEYKSRKRRNVKVAETFCGRKTEHTKAQSGFVTCFSCISAMAAKARKSK